ncbi:MAG: hypothetical protein KDD69_15160, partial [Bdellovibrionales bacterium]|nr:hypothetical protein [Bdellovibrionales bacterium]
YQLGKELSSQDIAEIRTFLEYQLGKELSSQDIAEIRTFLDALTGDRPEHAQKPGEAALAEGVASR